MYVLKRLAHRVEIPDNDDFNNDSETSEWKYDNNYRTLTDEKFRLTDYQQHESDILIHEKINYNADQILIRTRFGYASTQGVFSCGQKLNILGWNKLKMNEQDPYSEVFNTNNHLLMNLMYTIAKVWLKSYIQFPNSYSYIEGKNNTTFADDAFINFSPDMKTYHLPDSGGSYLSRFKNDTSHILLTIALEDIINYQSIYLTVILLDFMAYASHNISKLIHLRKETVCEARQTFKKRITKSANKYNLQFKYITTFEASIDDVFIMPHIRHHDDTVLSLRDKYSM